MPRDGRHTLPHVLGGVLAGWALLVALLLLEFGPDTPRSFREWVLLLVVGPPAYLALAWLGERVQSPLVRISPPRFSCRWFAWILFLAAIGGSAVVALSIWWLAYRVAR